MFMLGIPQASKVQTPVFCSSYMLSWPQEIWAQKINTFYVTTNQSTGTNWFIVLSPTAGLLCQDPKIWLHHHPEHRRQNLVTEFSIYSHKYKSPTYLQPFDNWHNWKFICSGTAEPSHGKHNTALGYIPCGSHIKEKESKGFAAAAALTLIYHISVSQHGRQIIWFIY